MTAICHAPSTDHYDEVIDPAFNHRITPSKPQFIRLFDGEQNGNVGRQYNCPEIPEREDVHPHKHKTVGPDRTTATSTDYTTRYTRVTYHIDPVVPDPDGDFGLSANDCYPRGLKNNDDCQGYALLNSDPWFHGRGDDEARQILYL